MRINRKSVGKGLSRHTGTNHTNNLTKRLKTEATDLRVLTITEVSII